MVKSRAADWERFRGKTSTGVQIPSLEPAYQTREHGSGSSGGQLPAGGSEQGVVKWKVRAGT